MEQRPVRALIAVVGLDTRDRDAKILARALRDGGMEVVYTGLRQTPDDVIRAAIDEDADAICLSSNAGAHAAHIPRVLEGLHAAGAGDRLVIVSGTIPPDDAAALRAAGVAAVFGPGTPLAAQVAFIRDHAPRGRAANRSAP